MSDLSLLYTVSVDGYIADAQGKTPFSSASWELYLERVRDSAYLVMGRTTYELFLRDPSIRSIHFDGRHVLSQHLDGVDDSFCLHHSVDDLRRSLAPYIQKKGIVLGGASVATTLLRAQMLSHIILIVDPLILGEGTQLFLRGSQMTNLELQSVKNHRGGIVEIQYLVQGSKKGGGE